MLNHEVKKNKKEKNKNAKKLHYDWLTFTCINLLKILQKYARIVSQNAWKIHNETTIPSEWVSFLSETAFPYLVYRLIDLGLWLEFFFSSKINPEQIWLGFFPKISFLSAECFKLTKRDNQMTIHFNGKFCFLFECVAPM